MPAPFDNDQFILFAKKWPAEILQYLHKHFYHKLVHLSQQRTNDRHASEDIVQEVLIEVWCKLDKLIAREGFFILPYLLMLVRHRSITHYNKSVWMNNYAPDYLDTFMSRSPSAEEVHHTTDVRTVLSGIVERLPHRERECVRLKYFEGMSNESIATRLGVSKKTIEKRLTTGISMLRQRMMRKE